ncbi:group II intron reverse transcriptase/maturase [Crocosphaera sp.]|uniref:group II intron reverse transcriptase/maturase n=1 Tax=Crocosphaera sp. TaxID=2729996 RepID=UPI00257C1531|nr:group II intron reverse transcriptase/maturase [Crocosphaera sp.]NQZ60651.1 group II intron reverse transcriptase/maturase [Crocosphaera sp.]
MSNASITKTTPEWNTINWAKVQRKVFKLQKRIFQAVRSGNKVKAKKLQKLLLKSHYAKLLATRKVTQDNQGKKTAGVDGKKALRPNQRLKLVDELRLEGYKAKALRRVWIPKPGRDEKRGLGIPTIKDRAMQALVKLALEPYWEAQFEGTSYGFRPGRSAHDAIGRIYTVIIRKAKYVLDADIAKCFDKINHDYLLSKVDCPQVVKRTIKQWLECGVMDNGIFEETETGTPQGGVISPLLANIALHGMINDVENHFPNTKRREDGSQKQGYKPKIIRYADDFVVLHEDYEVILQCKNLIAQWLRKIGLEIKSSKTRICHTLKDVEIDGRMEKAGFDFLGFNIRSYPVGKYHSGKTGGNPNKGQKSRLIGFKTLIKPSKKKILAHHEAIKEVIKAHKKAPQAALVARLNPIIRGWCNYYRTVASKETFSSEDLILWNMLRAWTISRKKKTPLTDALRKYFSHGKHRFWTFQTRDYVLYHHAETEIKRHQLVKPEASPYDGNWTYWSKRRGTYTGTPTRVAKLLKKQKGICPQCKQHFTPEDLIEVDHIIPKSKGGKDTYNNLQALHRHCHDVKSKNDYLYDWLDKDYEWKDDVLIVPMTRD